jgi:hypothetical protein
MADSDLPSTTRLVLHTLAMHMRRDGSGCYPGSGRVARLSALGRKTVKRHLQLAASGGWIAIERDPRPGGSYGTNTYRPTIPEPVEDVGSDNPHVGGGVTLTGGGVTESPHVGSESTPNTEDTETDTETDTKLADSENRPVVSSKKWEAIIERRDPWAIAFAKLDRLTHTEAKWLLRGLERAEHEEYVATDMEGPTELVALALYGMQRKPPHRWSRNRFVSFMVKAVAVRMDPTGHGEPDPDMENAVRRCWPL